MLAGIGFADIGFRVLTRKVRGGVGRAWAQTGHDLDRLIVREADGVRYGDDMRINFVGAEGAGGGDLPLEKALHLRGAPVGARLVRQLVRQVTDQLEVTETAGLIGAEYFVVSS